MAQSKDSYSVNHAPLHAGQIADGTLFNTESGLPVVDIVYGLGVVRDGNKIKVPASADDITNANGGAGFLGVVMYELNRALTDAQASVVPAGYDATVVTLGHVCVVVDQAVTLGDDVFLSFTGAGVGKFRKDANTNKAQILDGWEFKSTGSALAVIGPKANIVLPVASS